MKKKSIFSRILSCTIAIATLALAIPNATAKASTTWNNTSDVSWIDSSKKIIAFAFDDGPVTGNTANTILNTLEKYKMHATFFYLGNQINSANKSEIKRAYNIGCEVANHTYSHPYLTNLSASEIQNEVNKTANMLKEITGQSNYLIRPPYLAINSKVLNTINVPLITCSVDTKDWDNISKDQIIKTVLNANDGDILLMHETYNTTAQAVEYLVPELIKRGFVITSVSELFKIKGKTMTSGQVYTSCRGRNISNPKPSTDPTTPAVSGLKLDYNISSWGSAYQVGFKITNNSNTSVSTWTLKLKKSEVKITTKWNVNINESGDYYVITPTSWNANIPKGGSVEFGMQGSGSIGTTLNYTLE